MLRYDLVDVENENCFIVSRLRELDGATDTDGLHHGDSGPDQSVSENAVARLLTHPHAGTGGLQGDGSMLHFAQEKARQDVEISVLRKHKHQLEGALRELQHSCTLKEEKSVFLF